MALSPDEILSQFLLPGDRVRRGARLVLLDRIEITPGAPVIVAGVVLHNGKGGERVRIEFAWAEIVRRIGFEEPAAVAAEQLGLRAL